MEETKVKNEITKTQSDLLMFLDSITTPEIQADIPSYRETILNSN